MTDVIDFLERMGQDSHLRHGSQDEVELALASAEIAPELRVAILARDEQGLQALLGQDPFCCLISPAKPDEDEDEEQNEEQEECDGSCKKDKGSDTDKSRDGD